MHEHDQRWFLSGQAKAVGITGWIEKSVRHLLLARRKTKRLRARQLLGRQGLFAAGEDRNFTG
jgi:hypothetical protein